MSSRVHVALIASLAGFVIAIGWATVRVRTPTILEREITHRPVQIESDGYISSRTCKSCHPSQYEAWHRSYHRTMTQVASAASVRADFDGVEIASVHGRPMRLERRDSEFWAEFDDPDWDRTTDRPSRIVRQIVMTTGSHNQQVYWYRTDRNRLLGQLPGAYLIPEGRWIPRRAAFLRPPTDWPESETGRWNAVCIDCHTTHGKSGFDTPVGSKPMTTQVADTRVAEFGIACEACHGPSDLHVRANGSPLRRYWLHLTGKPDPTTVQPARLDPRRSSEVCGQCHGIWGFFDVDGQQRANAHGLPYRPGHDLRQTRFVAQPSRQMDSPTMKSILAAYPGFVRDSFWSDGMVRVSGREYNGLLDSPCFEKATDPDRTMSCFSCHTMHKAPQDPRSIDEWADTYQIAAEMGSQQACLQCHAPIAKDVAAHTNHRIGSTGSACYNCHMPYTTYGLLKALRSHQISSPTVAASVQTGRPNACNACHLDKTLEWTSEYLENWYGTPMVPLDDDQRTIAASLLWLLRGDAGQRALMAWSLGWQPAQQASGTSWMPPYLSLLLDDPYDAVRFIAARSLRSFPDFAGFDYDFVAPSRQRMAAGVRTMDVWRRGRLATSRTDAALLFDERGMLRRDEWTRLVALRDHRRVSLNE